MQKFAISTPEGTRDILFAECALRRRIEAGITKLFMRRGYTEVVTPSVEYYDVFLATGAPMNECSMLKLIDRTGSILVLRPDATTPIARVAATRLALEPPPYRLYYVQNVFRSDISHNGKNSEIYQAGVELIGASGRTADVEVLTLAVQALEASGVADYRIEIGHAGFFRALVSSLPLDEAGKEEIRLLVEEKNFAALNDFLRPYEAYPASAALKLLPQLFGGEEVFDEALALTDTEEAAAAIHYVRAIYDELSAADLADKVMVDFGLVHQMSYYTGIVFRGYAEGAGGTVLSGGRYDSLAASFGRELPATGFAIDIDAICQCSEVFESLKPTVCVYYAGGFLKKALHFIDNQPAGMCEMSACDTYEEAMRQARNKGFTTLAVIDSEGTRLVPVKRGL